MTRERNDALTAKYPKIFSLNKDTKLSMPCECGDGWYWLLDHLCAAIQGYLDSNQHLEIPQVVAVQVKEKFGGLRFYAIGGDDVVDGLIRFAEGLSESICEVCGSTNDVGCTNGWLLTICKPCYETSEPNVHNRRWVPR